MLCPVTQAEYQKVMGTNPSNCKGHDRRPVEAVNWFDAVAFCNKLSAVENLKPFYEISGEDVSIVGGSGYRLPTESEWEYACRAGTMTKWCFGDDELELKEYAWYIQNSGDVTHPVGEKKPNPWGLHDMLGNLWEWCWDLYARYEASQSNDPAGRELRVFRGGAFANPSSEVRSASRNGHGLPMDHSPYVGFRLAMT